ncbi:MAG: hypothetical protein HN849_26335 [Victivallales bacterium]|nr:hypothetical protein [Victivallales bacterium]
MLKTMPRTLAAYRSGLPNWHTNPISTGPLEGFNSKGQTMGTQAYGYRNMHFFMLKISDAIQQEARAYRMNECSHFLGSPWVGQFDTRCGYQCPRGICLGVDEGGKAWPKIIDAPPCKAGIRRLESHRGATRGGTGNPSSAGGP